MQLSQLPDAAYPDFDVFEVLEAGETIGVIRLEPTAELGAGSPILARIGWVNLASQSEALDLMERIEEIACERSSPTLLIVTTDELMRHVARARGFSGALRAPLTGDIPLVTRDIPLVTRDISVDPAARLHAVAQLLPECTLEMRNHGVAAVFGREAKFVDFVAGHPALPKDITVRVPNRADTMPEAVASIIDTAISVLHRYPVGILRISCENASYGLDSGQHAGETYPNVGMVYLNASYVLADDMERAQQTWIARNPTRRRTPMVPAPFTRLDGIVAHELWHRIEDAHHKADWIGIHRALGEELGVDTLEHALQGGAKDAPAAWQLAYRRVVEEVSRYATTNPREAKAEMFMQWWCRGHDPAPVVVRFGSLIEHALG